MGRSRSLDDDQILELVDGALGDADNTWTLAGAATAAGLHPATLIKRFGSRRGLLLALSRRWVNSIPLGPTSKDAYQELLGWADATSAHSVSTEQILIRIDALMEDLRDLELRGLLHQGWQQTIEYLTAVIDRARQDDQIQAGLASETMARLLLDAAHGNLLRTAVDPAPENAELTGSTRALLEALT